MEVTIKSVRAKMQCSEVELFAAWVGNTDTAVLCSMSGLESIEIALLAKSSDWIAQMARLPADRKLNQADAVKVNRAKNLALFERLRGCLEVMVEQLESGTLTFDKPTRTKEGVEVVKTRPTSGDIVNLCNAMKTVTEGTGKCLGDVISIAQPRSVGNAQSAQKEIVVHLPSVLSSGEDSVGEIDVENSLAVPASVQTAVPLAPTPPAFESVL